MRKKRVVLYVTLVALYALDPYSRGEAGELSVFSGRPWQIVATACLALILTVGAVRELREVGRTRRLARLESAGFVLLNILYIARDGATRFWYGYEHTPIGFVVVIVGIVLRTTLLSTFPWRDSEIHPPTSAP